MNKEAKYIISMLNAELNVEERSPLNIATAVARLVVKGKLQPGSRFLSQAEMKEGMVVTVLQTQRIWEYLLDPLKIITTNKRAGTYIISNLDLPVISRIKRRITSPHAAKHDIMLDGENIKRISLSYDQDVNTALDLYHTFSAKKQKLKTIPGLAAECGLEIGQKLGFGFDEREVYCTDHYEKLLEIVIKENSEIKDTIVVIDPTSGIIRNTIIAAKRDLQFLHVQESTDVIDVMGRLCRDKKVAIVCIGTTAPFPLLFEKDEEVWSGLHALQRTHGFLIVVDDRFPDLITRPSIFAKMPVGGNRSVIFITPMSIHPKLNKLNVVLGPQQIIGRIRRRLNKESPMTNRAIGYAILELMQKGKFSKNELKTRNLMKEFITQAKETIRGFDRFNPVFIEKQQAYFFFLQLKTGSLPRNFYAKLEKLGIQTMDQEGYRLVEHYGEGILISIANYTGILPLDRDLKILYACILKMIKK